MYEDQIIKALKLDCKLNMKFGIDIKKYEYCILGTGHDWHWRTSKASAPGE